MNFLKKIVIQNFRCIRQEVIIELNQATYLAGANNSGKTAFLAAIRCFFDTESFKPSDLNKTEFAAKKAGFNTSEISIEFDLNLVEGKARKKRMIDKYGNLLLVKKMLTYREASNTINVEYTVNRTIFGECIISSVKAQSTSNPAHWPMERSGIGQCAGRRPLSRLKSGLVSARPWMDYGGVKI